ncbi:hypothetical protein SASPL_149321 [Salvia splendens]|uniref:CCHC-type domain-containing protein n=1 Tax=Salvia splendens TaxID=180675 RepID=A0A8X8WBI1_SALSN|nr:hypothetical protein SASPL_149321 [Salvia splendens]
MKTLLASLDLWELVDEGYDEANENENLTAAQIKEFKKTKQRDAASLSKIQQAVADSIFPRIMGAEKSKEAWEILQKEFGGDEKVRAIKLQTLRRDFENTKMKDNETLNQFHSSFIELTNQMRVYGEEISDQRMIEKILICLPKRFNAIVAVIEQTKDISKMSIYELMGSLKSYEERLLRQSEKPIESAFQSKLHLNAKSVGESSFSGGQQNRSGTYGRGRGQEKTKHGGRGFHKAENGKKCTHCGKSNHEYKDCWFKDKPKCHKCSRFGHLQKDCYANNQPQQQQYANFLEEKQSEEYMFYASQSKKQKDKDVWYLDSGCSNHTTGDESIFVSIDTSVNSQVKMGNGALVKAQGKGTISVDTKKGKKRISDVLLVPDLRQNLLSVGQLIEHGYTVHFEGNSCVILDQEGAKQIVAKIQMEKSRSFPLTFKTPIEAWSGRKPSVKHLRVFGSVCYAQTPKEKRQKLDETSVKCILVGYSNMSKGYRLYNLKTRSIITSRDVIFDENASWNWEVNEVQKSGSVIDETQQAPTVEDEGDGDEGADFSSPNDSNSNSDPSSQIDAYFIEHGFERSKSESTLYVKTQGTSTLIVALYVDDLLFCGDDEKMIHDFKIEMMKRYEMSDMGLLHHFLGMEIYQENDGVFICQRKYVENILKKFGMSDCNPTLIPLVVNEKMKKEDGEKKIDASIYRSMVGSLLYLCATRPDIMFACSMLSRFMNSPSQIHLGVAKRVLRYIKGTTNFGIKYVKGAQVNLQGYCDSNWAGCLDDMKSTTGYSFSLGSSVFSWTSKK